jgi:hypothetical protein
LHRIKLNTKVIKKNKKENIDKVMDAIKKLKFNNKEFNYYQQTIKTTL